VIDADTNIQTGTNIEEEIKEGSQGPRSILTGV
jgi:hypothetical protein